MACRLLIVVVGLLSIGSASFAPITWANAPGTDLTLLPQRFTGPLSKWSNDVPQKLAVGEPVDSRMAFFSAKPDNTISVEGWCVEAVGAKSGDAVNVNVCNGGAAQQWNWIPEGHGRNKIQLKDTNLCLDVNHKEGRSNGAAVQLQQCEDTSSESWLYEAPEFGYGVQHVMMAVMSLAGVGALSLGAWLWQRHSKAPVVLGGMLESGVSMTAPTVFSRTGDAHMRMDDAPILENNVIKIKRVTTVRKGGKKMSFQALVAVGDGNGQVGVGIGKGRNPRIAITKGVTDATRNRIKIGLTDVGSIPHEMHGKFRAAKIVLVPARAGKGVVAGGATKKVLEIAGFQNISSKQLGSNNLMNNAKATIECLKNLKAMGHMPGSQEEEEETEGGLNTGETGGSSAGSPSSRTGGARMSMGDATEDDMVEGGVTSHGDPIMNIPDGKVNRRDFALNAAAVATGLVGIATNAQPASAKAGQFGNLSFFGTGLSSPFEEGGNKVGKDVTYGFKKSAGPMLADAYVSDVTREKAQFMEAEKIIRAQGPYIESKTWWQVQSGIRVKEVGDMRANMNILNAASKDPKASAKATDKFWTKINALELACVNKDPEKAKKAYAKALEALDAYKAIAL